MGEGAILTRFGGQQSVSSGEPSPALDAEKTKPTQASDAHGGGGQASISVAMYRYGHLMPGSEREAARLLDVDLCDSAPPRILSSGGVEG